MMVIRKGGGGSSLSSQPPAGEKVKANPDNYGEPLSLPPDLKMLLVGDTGAGKTSQIGLLAEYLAATENKVVVVFTADKGGKMPLVPYEKVGIVRSVQYDSSIDPWVWISHALRGESKEGGKWVSLVGGDVGMVAFEGLTAFSEMILMNLSEDSAVNPGKAVGGDSAWTFEARDGAEVIKIASNTQSHYGLVQLRIMQEIWKAAPGVASLWTSILKRTTDTTGGGGLLGPQVVGSALTPSIPRWFDYTFRINAIPFENGPARHVLYLETHLDRQAKGAKVVANARLPLAGGDVKVDAVIDPADLVTALLQIERRNNAGVEDVERRLEMIRGLRPKKERV